MKKIAIKTMNGFGAAIRGLRSTLIKENSFRIMIAIALLVVISMFYFPTSRSEKVALLLMIFTVLGLELINSTIEKFLDFINPEHDQRVAIIKDLMASIVLVASFGSAIIGLIIFWPYIFE